MTLRRFDFGAIDALAVVVGLGMSVPFLLLIIAPFLPIM